MTDTNFHFTINNPRDLETYNENKEYTMTDTLNFHFTINNRYDVPLSDRAIPVSDRAIPVSGQTELNCGDLAIKLVNKFNLVWWDKMSGGRDDGAFYSPIVPQGYYCLGHYGQGNYNTPTGVLVVVKELKSGALARPTDYELVWTDAGSGATLDGAFWRPIPPQGYSALGLVATRGWDKPSTDIVRCVRNDLVVQGKPGSKIWTDANTGAKKDFGSWEIISPPISGYEEYSYIAAGTFYGVASHTQPNTHPVLNCLKLKLPFVKPPINNQQPTLESTLEPPPQTEPQLANYVWIPFFGVKDDSYGLAWKVENSPFYLLERYEFYTRQWHYFNNSQETDQKQISIKTGISKTESTTYSVQTGISITAESGVTIEGIFSSKISTTLNKQMGFESSSSFTQMQETTTTDTYNIPPRKAVALWTKTNRFVLKRMDGSVVGNYWNIQTNSTVKSQFSNTREQSELETP